MKSQKTRNFEIQGGRFRFDADVFKSLFYDFVVKEKMKIGELEKSIAKELGVSIPAVHNWRMGINGPADIELIQALAKRFQLKDLKILLKKSDGGKNGCLIEENRALPIYSDKQIESIKRIYDAIIDFLNEFNETDGFTGVLWLDFKNKGVKDVEEELYFYVEKKINIVYTVIDKEYFYLHGLKIYDELIEFAYGDLVETYDGKLGYAYRFEAIPEGNSTTEEDYTKALKRIREIILPIVDNSDQSNRG